MTKYADKQALKDEIKKRAALFNAEFDDVPEKDKDKLISGVDRTPSQMLAYQLGWMKLLLSWESQEQNGKIVITPHPDYKWNKLGELYQDFYRQYQDYSLQDLQKDFTVTVQKILTLIDSYSDKELFEAGGRKWAASQPSNWPIWQWIHINTVAPFKSFRTKIRKWKKLNQID